MKKTTKTLILHLLVLVTFFSGMTVYAQTGDFEPGSSNTSTFEPGSSNPSGSGGETSVRLNNPLAKGGVNDIPTLVEKLLNIALTIGVPIIALAIIYAGYQFVAAQGNPGKLETAKKTLVYVVIGAVILLGAYVIAESIVGTVNAIRGN